MNRCLTFLLALCFSLPVAAQNADLEAMPGYVDFGSLSSVYGEPRVMINISGLVLKFMAAATAAHQDEAEAAELMRNLKAVRVNVYSTAGVLEPALEQIARVKEMLQKHDWQPVVQVRESDEEVQIFMKADDTGVQGLTVMSVDSEEAVFINILGQIDPSQLSVVMDKLDVDINVDAEQE
jgi:hypothetical protein